MNNIVSTVVSTVMVLAPVVLLSLGLFLVVTLFEGKK